MVDSDIHRRLLENVLDALDDLFDRRKCAELWVYRLLVATGAALRGTPWEQSMAEAASAIEPMRFAGLTNEERRDAALTATDDLRHRLADALDG